MREATTGEMPRCLCPVTSPIALFYAQNCASQRPGGSQDLASPQVMSARGSVDTSPMSEPENAIPRERWACGAKHVGERPLTPEERKWASRLCTSHLLCMGLAIAILPAAFVVVIAVADVYPAGADGWPILLLMMFALLLGAPVSILIAKDHGLAAEWLRRDLSAGMAWTFESPPDATETVGVVSGPRDAFALMPHSGRRIDLSSRSLSTREESVLDTEPQLGVTLYAPLSLPLHQSPQDGTSLRQRALTGSERSELERVRASLAAPRFSTFVASMLFLWLAWLLLANAGKLSTQFGELCSTVIMLLACVQVIARWVRSRTLATRIRHDLELGLLVRVDQVEEHGAEVLPTSGLSWRVGGAPAEWRDKKAAERLRNSL